MAGYNVTAKLIPNAQRALEIEPGAFAPQVGGGSGSGFGRHIDREPISALVDHGQASARTGDRRADGDTAHVIAALDGQPQVAVLLGLGDGADVGDDPGEH